MLRRWRASCDSEQCWGILPSLPWRAIVCRAPLCAQLEAFRNRFLAPRPTTSISHTMLNCQARAASSSPGRVQHAHLSEDTPL